MPERPGCAQQRKYYRNGSSGFASQEWDINIDQKKVDQPLKTKSGRLTQNEMFAKAVDDYKESAARLEIVRVYEESFLTAYGQKRDSLSLLTADFW